MTTCSCCPTRRALLVGFASMTTVQLSQPAAWAQPTADTAADEAIENWITALGLSPDGMLLAAAGGNRQINIFKVADGRLVRTITYPSTQNAVGALAFSDDNKMLYAGNAPQRRHSKGKSFLAFDIDTGEFTGGPSVEPNWVARMVSNSNAGILASIGLGFDRSIRFWRKDSLQLERLWQAHDSAVMALAMSADGRLIASGGGNSQRGGRDPSIKIWDVASGRELRKLSGHKDSVKSLAFTPDGRRLVSIASDAVKVWSVDSGALVRTIGPTAPNAGEMTLAPNGAWFAIVVHNPDDDHETLSIRSVATGRRLQQWTNHWQAASQLAASPDGRTLFAGGKVGQVIAVDVRSGQQIGIFKLDETTAKPQ